MVLEAVLNGQQKGGDLYHLCHVLFLKQFLVHQLLLQPMLLLRQMLKSLFLQVLKQSQCSWSNSHFFFSNQYIMKRSFHFHLCLFCKVIIVHVGWNVLWNGQQFLFVSGVKPSGSPNSVNTNGNSSTSPKTQSNLKSVTVKQQPQAGISTCNVTFRELMKQTKMSNPGMSCLQKLFQ